MKPLNLLSLLLIWMPLAALIGCGDSGPPPDAPAFDPDIKISYCVSNQTSGDIKDVAIAGAGRPASFGTVKKGATDVLTDRNFTVPLDVELVYQNAQGQRKFKKVKLSSVVGPAYRGAITLTITQQETVLVRAGH